MLIEKFNKTKEIIIKAGEILREGFFKNKKINLKGKKDLVTEYDLKIEEFLKENLKGKFLAEETQKHNTDLSDTFIIDPIDGTTNFTHQIPHCAISVAYYKDNEPQFGIVYNPILEELFYATDKAYLNGKEIKVSKNAYFQRALIATGFPYSSADNKEDLNFVISRLQNILPKTQDIRRLGSAALDLCYVASGKFEGFYEINLKPWDVAAGMFILQKAGGRVTNLQNSKFNFFEEFIFFE